jgi:hypothetical protein
MESMRSDMFSRVIELVLELLAPCDGFRMPCDGPIRSETMFNSTEVHCTSDYHTWEEYEGVIFGTCW